MTTANNIRIEALRKNRNFVYSSLRRDYPNSDIVEVAKVFASYFVASQSVDDSELDYTDGAEIEIGSVIRSFMIEDVMGVEAAIESEEVEAFASLSDSEKLTCRLHNINARVFIHNRDRN